MKQITLLFALQVLRRKSGFSHKKKWSGNSTTFFVYIMLLPWLVHSLFARGQNLTESFNNMSLNVKFCKKYNLRQARLSLKISWGFPEWNGNEWSKLLYFLLFKFYEKNLNFVISEYLRM